MVQVALLVVFPFLTAYAAASDLLTMTIPNRVSLGLVAGFAVFALAAGLPQAELLSHGGAALAVLAATFTMFALGWMGGGDAKLAAATALWLGFDGLGDYLLLVALAGGALTLGIVIARGQMLPAFALRLPFVTHLHDAKTGIPYGIALAAAALLALPESGVWMRAFAV